MKTNLYFLMILLFVTGSCTSRKGNVVKYTIASQTMDCSGVGKQKCMLVKRGDASDWEFFYNTIEGFEYEEGNEYVVEVEEMKVDNPPADASSLKYILVKQISKTPKTSENMPVKKNNMQAQYRWVGKVLSVDNETTGRGAAEGKFPATVVRLQVTSSETDLFKAGDIIHCELITSPKVQPVVGREYVFKAEEVHPAHADGIYMLRTDVMDLV